MTRPPTVTIGGLDALAIDATGGAGDRRTISAGGDPSSRS
jgi:hypothetical protein